MTYVSNWKVDLDVMLSSGIQNQRLSIMQDYKTPSFVAWLVEEFPSCTAQFPFTTKLARRVNEMYSTVF